MNMKLRALGLGLLAVLATSAFAVVNASAESTGHFTSEKHHLKIEGTETNPGNHNLKFQRTNAAGEAVGSPIECTHVKYHGTLEGAAATTTNAVTLTPEYQNCGTTGGTWNEVTVHHPKTKECETKVFKFTSGGTGTVHVECAITVTHPNCTIVVPKQTVSGVTYTTDLTEGVHSLTAHVNAQNITGHFEAGLCVFLGTTHKFHMKGSVTVWARDIAGFKTPITHTVP